MINYIKRKDLDAAKYDACITTSIQSRIYALSWYLDIVANHWDVLVLDDYKAVMPIPWQQKYLLKYIAQPPFCQQLGIFSKDEITEEIQHKFITKIPKKFLKGLLVLNSKNYTLKNNFRSNYFIHLQQEYSVIKGKFSKGRKHAITVANKNELYLKNIKINALVEIQKNNYTYQIQEEKLQKLVLKCMHLQQGEVIGVFKGDTLLGGAFFIQSNTRIIYLYAAYNSEARKYQAPSFLLSSVIKKYSNTDLLFDFEGGNLPNIGKFYRSFGATQETYSFLERTFL